MPRIDRSTVSLLANFYKYISNRKKSVLTEKCKVCVNKGKAEGKGKSGGKHSTIVHHVLHTVFHTKASYASNVYMQIFCIFAIFILGYFCIVYIR